MNELMKCPCSNGLGITAFHFAQCCFRNGENAKKMHVSCVGWVVMPMLPSRGHCFRRWLEFRVVALGGWIYILVCHVYCLAFARELFAAVLVETKEMNLGFV
jgi:hypothetical protein